MASLKEVKEWISRDVRPRRWRVAKMAETNGNFVCQVTADRHVFTIAASTDGDYLGCTCRARRFVAGESHPRFADLPDGPLNADTWQAIFAEMQRMEIRSFRGPAL